MSHQISFVGIFFPLNVQVTEKIFNRSCLIKKNSHKTTIKNVNFAHKKHI